MTAKSIAIFFIITALVTMSGAALAETGMVLGEIRASIDRSKLSQEERVSLSRKASEAVTAGLPSSDVAVIVKRGLARGADVKKLEEMLDVAIGIKEKGLPVRPVLDRIEQGLSKGVAHERITASIRQMASKLAAADAIVKDISKSGVKAGKRADMENAIHTVARALEKAIPGDEITKVGTKVVKQGASMSRFEASVNAMTAFVEMGMPFDRASKMIHKVMDKGYSEADMIMMEREIAGMLRDGEGMEEVMRSMESMIDTGKMGEWHKGMEGGSTMHNSPGTGSHHRTGGSGMGGHRH